MSLNLNEIFAMLSDKVPAWGPLIGMLEFRESKDAAPVASDGRVIYYNTKKMQYYTPSTQMFYFAQQLLHIQLAHQQRGEGRDPDLWRRATDDVVSEMLIADGFQQPEDRRRRPEAAGVSAEELYVRYYRQAEEDEEAEEAPPELEKPPQKKADPKGKRQGSEHGAKDREIEDPGLAKAVEIPLEMGCCGSDSARTLCRTPRSCSTPAPPSTRSCSGRSCGASRDCLRRTL